MVRWSAALLSAVLMLAVTACAGSPARGERHRQLSEEQMREFASLRLYFAHQSVGANIISGIPQVLAAGDIAAQAVVAGTVPPGEPSFILHEFVGTNGDASSKLSGFRGALSRGTGSEVDIALVKLCFLDVHAGSDVAAIFDEYVSTMTTVEALYPGVRFVYTTVPLTVEPGMKSRLKWLLKRQTHPDVLDNVAREKYNARVRDRYGSSGRLFDIALIESTRSDGGRDRYDHDGESYYTLDRNLAADPGHLNADGSAYAAEGLIRAALPA